MTVTDLAAFVRRIVDEEAPSVEWLIEGHERWVQVEVPLAELDVDEALIARHDADALHCARRDRVLGALRDGAELPPLLAVPTDERDLWLIDGYARVRALRLMGVDRVQVVRPDAQA
jgi:hypothetical protein